eukprot:TRINITY_DN15633_c0_g1_i1.p1 TRINITY_DN15633_c0_g1~~TRINITY_DN15633_c0_g1_i1.p1  ORF type:complete len:128 (+),score=13.04 TRINITY_DN15633_c0_g1_i1:367-750(+)
MAMSPLHHTAMESDDVGLSMLTEQLNNVGRLFNNMLITNQIHEGLKCTLQAKKTIIENSINSTLKDIFPSSNKQPKRREQDDLEHLTLLHEQMDVIYETELLLDLLPRKNVVLLGCLLYTSPSPRDS